MPPTSALTTREPVRPRPLPFKRIMLFWVMGLVLLGGVAGAAEPPEHEFNIPAQPLAGALDVFAEQSDTQMLYRLETVEGLRSSPVVGRYPADQALQRLLDGTGLSFRLSGPNTFTVVRSSKDPTSLDATENSSATGATEQPQPIEVPEIVVQEVKEEGYLAKGATTATRTDTPIREIPQSIQVVPRQVIEDQAAQRLEDVYTNVSGVVETGNTLNASREVLPVIRGFESPIILRNGMRTNVAGSGLGAVDLINIESVEVLKGPASVLFGALEPGGVLSFTTKKPLPEPHYDVNQQFGNYDRFRTTVDATGPLLKNKKVLYRLNAAYTNSDTFRDFVDIERYAVAPSLSVQLSERTEFLLDFSYTREEVPFDSGVPFGFDDEPLVPIDTFFGDPDLDGRTLEDFFTSTKFVHHFNETFTVRNQFQFHRADIENEGIRNRGVGGSSGSETLGRRFQNQDRRDDTFEVVTDLIARFETFGIEHETLMGVDYVLQDSENRRFRQNLPAIPITSDPMTDFDPPENQPKQVQLFTQRWVAGFLQDQISMFDDRLHLLLGGRFDSFHSESEQDGVPSPDVDESELTGRAGVLFELTDWMSPYASIAQSFNPQGAFAVDASGNVIAPEEGIQYEGGFKFNFFEERLLATVAAFHIEKENVAVFDLPFFLSEGIVAFTTTDQRSRGVELDVSGQITEGLSIIGNYAFIDTEVLENKADPSLEGEDLGNVPRHSVRTWLAYNFLPGTPLEGLGFGFGLRHESSRRAQFDDLQLDDFVVFDLGAWYRKPLPWGQTLKAQLNIQNLTDKEFYPRASGRSIVHPGDPLTVFGQIGVEF